MREEEKITLLLPCFCFCFLSSFSSSSSSSSSQEQEKKEIEMARVTHDQPSDRISGDDGPDDKNVTEYLDEVVDDVDKRPQGLEPPPLVRAMSPAEREVLEKQLTRKIDIRLLPPVIIMYILNYLDRNNIATARLAGTPGLEEDLGLTDSQYETCVSILFVGYILMVSDSRLSLSLQWNKSDRM